MNADLLLQRWQAQARIRRGLVVAAFALPWLLALAAIAWRFADAWPGVACIVATMVAVAVAWRAVRRVDAHWLARRLDARRADMEDSAALLFAARPTPLQALQRERLRARIAEATPVDLRERWPRRPLALSGSCALLALAAALAWPLPAGLAAPPVAEVSAPGVTKSSPRLLSARLEIAPPAYTALPRRAQAALDARAPAGAGLRWTLRFAPQPASATLSLLDGRSVRLQRQGDAWTGELRVERSLLYRVTLPTPLPKAQAALHRIDVAADAPPVLRAIRPAHGLSPHAPGQRSWRLLFEADDDYGLAPLARLEIVQTQGSGENIIARQRSVPLQGAGTLRHRRWAHALDLAALGLSPGDDLIVRLVAFDNHAPRAQATRSPSFILRWPPEATTETSGMDGLVRTALPAYLRSQRQVIIDAEALLKQRRALDAPRFLKRSSALGDDQQALRLRYGQFLGEESEGAPKLPTSDLPTSDAPDAGEGTPAPAAHDDHAGALPPSPPKFGDAGDVLADYGHVHDSPEAATLLDPETKETLRAALRQMWESELHLRQGDPAAALPYAYKALAYIKQVQQADRIYLARTGIEAPPVDEGRRLTGKRDGLGDRADVLAPAPAADPVPARTWLALQDSAARAPLDVDALERWVRGLATHGGDPLAVLAAIDAVRQDPACVRCRARLRAALWPLLPRPPAATGARARADAAGRAYLEALGEAVP